ncbi:hypothetical protein OHC33_000596 [Knufia fluminis]|uniref:Apple domain-containing protein n=1 Tax=Knufia fluminis TaxID=191047 RepID=A0AAN8F828_9EURO|nr:hypothetical protein OHC33_000596 [Knufia fluminis]
MISPNMSKADTNTDESGLHLNPNPYTDLPQVYIHEPTTKSTSAESAPQLAPGHTDAPEVVARSSMNDNKGYGKSELAGPKTSTTTQEDKVLLEIEHPNRQSQRRILGLRRKTFVLACVGIALAVLAISLGTGLGVSRNGTEDTGTVVTSGMTGMAEIKCPGINNTQITFDSNGKLVNTSTTTTASSNFQVRCAVHYPEGRDAENGDGTVKNVGSEYLIAYTLEQCLGYCVEYNNQTSRAASVDPDENGSGCLAVSYNANLTDALQVENYGRNCWLKDRVGTSKQAKGYTESAVLLG